MQLIDIYSAPGHLIRRSQQISVGIFMDELAPWKVTPVQYAALIAIRNRPGIDQQTLVNLIAADRSTVGAMLSKLESRKLIKRKTPASNRRVKHLSILKAGIALLDESREAIYRVQERILAPLNQKEREALLDLLARTVHLNNEHSRAPLRTVAEAD